MQKRAMTWDNSPLYRKRRRIVLGALAAAVALIVLIVWAITNALRPAPAPIVTGPRERTGAAPAITIAFGGDTHAHGTAGRINDAGLGETGQVLAQADLAMVNLETVVAADSAGLRPQPKPYTFVTSPKILDTLKAQGIDIVTAANNHTMDFGAEGMKRMLAVKASSPLPMVGLGADDTEAWAPWITDVKGRKVVVFGATDVLDAHLDWKAAPGKPGLAKVKDDEGFAKLVDGVRRAREINPDDVVVVYLHSGSELVKCPTARQQETAKALSAAGADVVIGSHAHLLQPSTTIGNTAVAYGMGNFVFDSFRAETRATGVLTVTVPGTPGPASMEFAPARIDKGLPMMLTGDEREKAIAKWNTAGDACQDKQNPAPQG